MISRRSIVLVLCLLVAASACSRDQTQVFQTSPSPETEVSLKKIATFFHRHLDTNELTTRTNS